MGVTGDQRFVLQRVSFKCGECNFILAFAAIEESMGLGVIAKTVSSRVPLREQLAARFAVNTLAANKQHRFQFVAF